MPWKTPVDIELYGTGKYRIVTDTPTASECLLYQWPDEEHGEEYADALQSCLDDLAGEPADPRASFIRAAKAAGLMIRPSMM